MKRIKFWAALAVFGIGLGVEAFGQTKGDEVVVVVKQADLKHSGRVVETTYRGNYHTVRDVNGNWLWVEREGTRGWIQRDHVILASRALIYFTDELRSNPKDVDALVARALAWKNKQEYGNAIRDCTDAIAIDSTRTWAYLIRGNSWLDKQEYDLAISDYDEVIRQDSTYTGAYNNRALCHSRKKNYDHAIADLTEAIRQNPKDARYFDNRGDAYYNTKEFDRALADYTMAIELDPQKGGAYAMRGLIYEVHKSQPLKALADYSTAIAINPKSSWYLRLRASLHVARKNFEQGLADYNTAVELDSNDACAINGLAWLLATCPESSIRNGDRAVQLAKRAVELTEDKNANLIDTLAAAYAEQGNFEMAVKEQQRAYDLVAANRQADFQSRLDLYLTGQPYRDVPKSDVRIITSATAPVPAPVPAQD